MREADIPLEEGHNDMKIDKGSMDEDLGFPDGGLKAWSVVVGGFLCLFCSTGFLNAVGVFQTYYMTDRLKDYTPFQIGWIASFLAFFMNLGGVVGGPLFDVFGPRCLIISGSFLAVVGMLVTSFCKEYYQFFLAQGVVTGAGLSLVFQAGSLSVSTWFSQNRGLALGVMMSGSSLGGVCYPVMLKRLFDRIGFGWSVRVAAFLMLGCLIVANFLIHSRLPPPGRTKRRRFLDLEAFKGPSFCLVCSGTFLGVWATFTPVAFMTSYALSYGFSNDLAFYLISMLNAASMFGRIVTGIMADRLGVFNIMTIFTMLSGIFYLGMWIVATSHAAIISVTILIGFFSGGYISVFIACVAKISPMEKFGSRLGFVLGVSSIAGLTGIPISGALQIEGSLANGFGPMILFSGTALVMAGFSYAAARVLTAGWKINLKV